MTILLYIALLSPAVHCYTPAPRWGQATSLLTSSLYVSAGKQDTSGFSYTGADAVGELLLLPLNGSFSVDSPPWELVTDPNDGSESQGPAVAWHTLSAFNESDMLLFGGFPSPNVSIATLPDSAWVLNAFDRLFPQFNEETSGWGGEPIRRIHHTAVTSTSGLVYMLGGEKSDFSMNAFSDHYVFDPSSETFTELPVNAYAPPALTGHGSVILSNGQIWVFGGLASSGLLSLGTFYVFDTAANAWLAPQNTSSMSIPSGRRAFAHVLIDDTAILIQGGASGDFLTPYNDGWVYNITTDTWTNVPILSEIGYRLDHFSVYYGDVVLFGFGYAANGAANSSLILYNPATQSFPTTFSPPAGGATPTLPIASNTNTATATSHIFSGTITSSAHPTSTGSSSGSSTTKATKIAVGTVVGLLAFAAVGLVIVWYIRRQHRKRWLEGGVGGVFSPLDGEGRPGHPSAARMVDAPSQQGGITGTIGATVGSLTGWIAGGLGLTAGATAVTQDRKERRDMLADEDTRDFGYGGWYDVGDGRSSRSRLDRLRQGSGGSTWSLMSVFRPNARRQASAASGMSYGSRGESLLGIGDEKDPFRDETSMHNVGSRSKRPSFGRRQSSYASVMTSSSNYHDPFSDPTAALELDITAPGALLVANRPEMLSPITEVSRTSQSDSSADRHTSSASIISPFDSLSRASTYGLSSSSHLNSPPPFGSPGPSSLSARARASSILDMRPAPPEQPMQRSDTWWARFANKSMLDRKATRTTNARPAPMDFRDPTPLPARLGFVQEETASLMAERQSSDGSAKEKAAAAAAARTRGSPYGRMSTHGKSMSSIKTADSAALDRMGDVGVMLRGNRQTGSTSTRGSVATTVDEGARQSWHTQEEEPQDVVYSSPVEMVPASSFNLPTTPSPTSSKPPSATAYIRPPLSTVSSASSSASGSSVSDRVKAYERRMSQDPTPATPPPTERPRNKSHGHAASYGLITRPSLFVANPGPNREASGSQDHA